MWTSEGEWRAEGNAQMLKTQKPNEKGTERAVVMARGEI